MENPLIVIGARPGIGVRSHATAESPVFASPVFASPIFASLMFASPIFASPIFVSLMLWLKARNVRCRNMINREVRTSSVGQA